MMPPAEEHHEIPNREATVKPVKGLKKQRRVCNLATERRQKKQERTQRNHGSRRKLAVACRKVSRHATVAWWKRKLVRRTRTQENYGPRKELTAARMRKSLKGNNDIRHRDVKEPPHLRKREQQTASKDGALYSNLIWEKEEHSG
jgi:hypothetical protein